MAYTPTVRDAGQTSVETTGEAVPAYAERAFAHVKNTHASTTIYVGVSGVATSDGFPVGPGESYTWMSTEALHAVASTGSATLAWIDYGF